jgi:hypothetical protein
MHTTELDLGPFLGAKKHSLGQDKLLRSGPESQPSRGRNDETIGVWSGGISVLVTDESVWPNADGTVGITSLAALRLAQSHGKASPDTPTNFFLFFTSSPRNHKEKRSKA